MQSKVEVDRIAKALADEWGQDAIETEQNRIYIEFADDITASLMVDCDLGVSHCLADLPKAFPPSLVPATFEDLCIYANRLNITLARELGVAQSFQVLDDTLKLNDTRPFQGVEDIVEVCDLSAVSTCVPDLGLRFKEGFGVVIYRRNQDDRQILEHQRACRAGGEGHSPGNPPAFFSRRQYPDRAGRPAW